MHTPVAMSGRRHLLELESDLVLNQRLLQSVAVMIEETLTVAQDIAQYCPDDDNLKKTTQDTMLSFVGMEDEIKQYAAALNHVKKAFPANHGGASTSAEDSDTSLTATFTQKLEELNVANSRDEGRLTRHPKYEELNTVLTSAGDLEEQLSSLKKTLSGASEDSQGELAMTEVEVNTRCPYTGVTMRDPVRNTRCGHVYDREGILTYIKQKKSKAKCPVGGCGNTEPVQASDLEDHRNMKRYITLLSQSQRC